MQIARAAAAWFRESWENLLLQLLKQAGSRGQEGTESTWDRAASPTEWQVTLGLEQGKNKNSEGCFLLHKAATCKQSYPERAHSTGNNWQGSFKKTINSGVFFSQWLNVLWLQLSLLLKAEPKKPSCLPSSRWWSTFRYKVVQHHLVPCLQGNRLFPALNNAVEKKIKWWGGSQKQTKSRERTQQQRASEKMTIRALPSAETMEASKLSQVQARQRGKHFTPSKGNAVSQRLLHRLGRNVHNMGRFHEGLIPLLVLKHPEKTLFFTWKEPSPIHPWMATLPGHYFSPSEDS